MQRAIPPIPNGRGDRNVLQRWRRLGNCRGTTVRYGGITPAAPPPAPCSVTALGSGPCTRAKGRVEVAQQLGKDDDKAKPPIGHVLFACSMVVGTRRSSRLSTLSATTFSLSTRTADPRKQFSAVEPKRRKRNSNCLRSSRHWFQKALECTEEVTSDITGIHYCGAFALDPDA